MVEGGNVLYHVKREERLSRGTVRGKYIRGNSRIPSLRQLAKTKLAIRQLFIAR